MIELSRSLTSDDRLECKVGGVRTQLEKLSDW